MTIIAIVFIILAIIFASCALLWSMSAIWSIIKGAPPVATPMNEIYWALKAAEPEIGETLFDLGCGDGRVLVIGARMFGLNGVGYESAPWGNLVTRAKLWDDDLRKKAKVKTKNIYHVKELGQADIIYLYLFPGMLKRLSGSFIKQLVPGTRIVSYAFPIPGWKADKIVTSQGNPDIRVYLYHVKKWAKEKK